MTQHDFINNLYDKLKIEILYDFNNHKFEDNEIGYKEKPFSNDKLLEYLKYSHARLNWCNDRMSKKNSLYVAAQTKTLEEAMKDEILKSIKTEIRKNMIKNFCKLE